MAESYAKHNHKKLSSQPFHLPDFRYVNNIDFYSRLNTLSFLRDIGKHFRVNTMLTRDSVRSRMCAEKSSDQSIEEHLNQNEGISFTEFSY